VTRSPWWKELRTTPTIGGIGGMMIGTACLSGERRSRSYPIYSNIEHQGFGLTVCAQRNRRLKDRANGLVEGYTNRRAQPRKSPQVPSHHEFLVMLSSRGSDPRPLGLTLGRLARRTSGERPRASRFVYARRLDQAFFGQHMSSLDRHLGGLIASTAGTLRRRAKRISWAHIC
jgi:hypothetical protein